MHHTKALEEKRMEQGHKKREQALQNWTRGVKLGTQCSSRRPKCFQYSACERTACVCVCFSVCLCACVAATDTQSRRQNKPRKLFHCSSPRGRGVGRRELAVWVRSGKQWKFFFFSSRAKAGKYYFRLRASVRPSVRRQFPVCFLPIAAKLSNRFRPNSMYGMSTVCREH
jgi:hypothetical protein